MSRRSRWVGRLVLLVGLALFVLLPVAAGAQDDGNYVPTTTVTTDPCTHTTQKSTSVCGTVVTVPQVGAASLPFTGGSAALLTVVGLGVVGAGVGLVMIGRRSASSTS